MLTVTRTEPHCRGCLHHHVSLPHRGSLAPRHSCTHPERLAYLGEKRVAYMAQFGCVGDAVGYLGQSDRTPEWCPVVTGSSSSSSSVVANDPIARMLEDQDEPQPSTAAA
jgi:hypothetical protein